MFNAELSSVEYHAHIYLNTWNIIGYNFNLTECDFLNTGLSLARFIKDFYRSLISCVYIRQYFKSLETHFVILLLFYEILVLLSTIYTVFN